MDESMKPQPDMNYLQNSFQRAAKDKSKEELKKKIIDSLSSKDEEAEGQNLAPGEQPKPKDEKKDGLEGLIDEGLDKVFGF